MPSASNAGPHPLGSHLRREGTASGEQAGSGRTAGSRDDDRAGAFEQAAGSKAQSGVLYLCATPIGNLEDMTFRVLTILRTADVIAAEDTRRTRALLRHFDIHARVTSLHRFNEEAKGEALCRRLHGGESVALVSDAGTPAISDPGEQLVAMAIERDIPIVALPGPSAVLTALSVSGLPTRRFAFEGFLPRHGRSRRRILTQLKDEDRTMVFFEAPHRIDETLRDMLDAWGDRRAVLARELTKVHEEVLRGSLEALHAELSHRPRRGEMVLIVEGAGSTEDDAHVPPPEPEELWQALQAELKAGRTKKDAASAVAERFGVSRQDVYAADRLYAEDSHRNSDR